MCILKIIFGGYYPILPLTHYISELISSKWIFLNKQNIKTFVHAHEINGKRLVYSIKLKLNEQIIYFRFVENTMRIILIIIITIKQNLYSCSLK